VFSIVEDIFSFPLGITPNVKCYGRNRRTSPSATHISSDWFTLGDGAKTVAATIPSIGDLFMGFNLGEMSEKPVN